MNITKYFFLLFIFLSALTVRAEKLCGNIYRASLDMHGNAPVKITSSSNSQAQAGDLILVAAQGNVAVEKTINKIVFPNDVYLGCVKGKRQQGYEGNYFITKHIELRGQPSGFSTGN